MTTHKFRFALLAILLIFLQSCQEDEPFDFDETNGNQIINGVEVGSCFDESLGQCADLSFHPVMVYLSLYSCSGYCIMKQYLDDCPQDAFINGMELGPEDYLNYFYESPTLNVDSALASNILVHESNHHLIRINPFANNFNIVLDCDQSWLVEKSNTFPSIELVAGIEAMHRTPLFNTYINGTSTQSTQVSGIFGLLEEFASYYQGAITIAEIAIQEESFDNILYVLNGALPYYEFKFWILQYLRQAEEFHPAIFDELLSNQNFKSSFLGIEEAFANAVVLLSQEIAPLEQLGAEEVKNVADLLESPAYQEMMIRLSN